MSTTPRGTEQLLAGGRGDQGQPAVSSQYIVWVDGTDINGRLRAGGTSFSVVRAAGDQYDPAVCGSLVVWTDVRNGNPDIYGRNLTGGGDFPIAATAVAEAYPDCDGSRVVYMRTDAGDRSRHRPLRRGRPARRLRSRRRRGTRCVRRSRATGSCGRRGPTQPNCRTGLRHLRASTSATGANWSHVTSGPGAPVGARRRRSRSWCGRAGRKARLPDVWYRDLAGGSENPVVTGSAQAPRYSGRRGVRQQQVHGRREILMKDL